MVIEGFGIERLIYEYNPRNLDFEIIVVTNPDDNISKPTSYRLSRNNIPVLVLNHDGELLSIIELSRSNAKTRIRQYGAHLNLRVDIGRHFLIGKIKHTEDFMKFFEDQIQYRH
jgi:CRISPR/Cas system-associated endonuclease Cas1